ncbi:hypothetical protein POF50_028875 [Streptomyces sp. SL13]|uniref:Uncharacterized protein n=1 Tax=Streptantibioticus silvisoli TaxID=2705255 RepID=A0AA90H7F4_9ACTN|nr:hypothetical protein [Streptantibioticus silvisoli]MDI5973311.1 hypothetical protein [Streptantibioticus silvisoli]
MPMAEQRFPSAFILHSAARLLTAAGLAVDAYVHAKLADQYDAVVATIGQGMLFRVEAGLACLAALLVLVRPNRLTGSFAWLVAAGGLAAILLYRYVDVGALGPLPDMYEPIWSTDKVISAVAQVVSVAAASYLLITRKPPRRARAGTVRDAP